jgi:tetratricopeptide (TPR) repeat protein
MRRWALLLALTASVLGALSAWAVVLSMVPRLKARQESDRLVDRAQEASSRGDRYDSSRLVEEALALDRRNPRARRERAMHLVVEGRQELALQELRYVAEAKRRDSGAARELAALLWATGDREGALGWVREALRRDPKSGLARVDLAHCLLATGDVGDALSTAEEAVALYPRLRSAWQALGVARWQSGDLTGAQAAFREALLLRPNDVPTLLAAAEVSSKLASWDSAVAYARRAVSADPQSPSSWFALAQLLAATGHSVEADEALARARTLDAAQSADRPRSSPQGGAAPERSR